MRKPNRNTDALYLPVNVAEKRYNMCRNTVLKVSSAAGATIRIGRVVRINADKFEEYLDGINANT